MNYYRYDGNLIERYDVNFNKNNIKKIRKMIVDNCSVVEHKEKSLTLPEISHNDYSEGKVIKLLAESNNNITYYTYDLIRSPKLVELIDELLNANMNVIDNIINYDYYNEVSVEQMIDYLTKEILNTYDVEIINKKVKYINKLYEYKNLRVAHEKEPEKPLSIYYNKLINEINVNYIDTVRSEELFNKDTKHKNKIRILSLKNYN